MATQVGIAIHIFFYYNHFFHVVIVTSGFGAEKDRLVCFVKENYSPD
jgi:hypothetical protein